MGACSHNQTPPLLVGREMSILTMPIQFIVDRPREIGTMAAGLPRCKLIPVTRTTIYLAVCVDAYNYNYL